MLLSVVFTSMYRIHVLLLQDTSDPSYTIAPSLGWTCIEISASIISASLPTLGPVVGEFLTYIGLKGNSGFSQGTYNKSTTTNSNVLTSLSKNKSAVPGQPRANPFYEIPDSPSGSRENEEMDSFSEQTAEEAFRTRPAHGFSRASMVSAEARRMGKEGDDIPLKGISVKTEFVQSYLKKTEEPSEQSKVWTEARSSYR